jgi:hypothetical protein
MPGIEQSKATISGRYISGRRILLRAVEHGMLITAPFIVRTSWSDRQLVPLERVNRRQYPPGFCFLLENEGSIRHQRTDLMRGNEVIRAAASGA